MSQLCPTAEDSAPGAGAAATPNSFQQQERGSSNVAGLHDASRSWLQLSPAPSRGGKMKSYGAGLLAAGGCCRSKPGGSPGPSPRSLNSVASTHSTGTRPGLIAHSCVHAEPPEHSCTNTGFSPRHRHTGKKGNSPRVGTAEPLLISQFCRTHY